jgi:NhaP-type Na+/H+ or K+/H+ antiporter
VVSTDQVLLGMGLILVLAVGSQVLARRLRIPALIILLPAGFIAGTLTSDVNPQRLLGPAFQSALMLGAILVVSGPTVVGPLLNFIRPTERLQRVLAWEGSLIDPVGATLGAVVFHAVIASTHRVFGSPRGIVAAATATTFSAGLVAHGIAGASKILPATFLVIVATVALYGPTAVPVARRLGVMRPARTRPLLVGGQAWVVDLACALRSAGGDLLFVVRSDGKLEPVTRSGAPAPQTGDTLVFFGRPRVSA